MEISKETKKEAIIYSLRGRIISFVGIFFTLMIGLVIFFGIVEMMYKDPYTSETEKVINFIGGFCLSIFSSYFLLIIFSLKKNVFFINPCWFIKEPTNKELKNYFSEMYKKIPKYLDELETEIKYYQKKQRKLQREKAAFFVEIVEKTNTDH